MTDSHHGQSAVTLSVRVPSQVREQLEKLADATGRTKSFLAVEAIQSYLMAQAWQVDAIQDALKKANSGNAAFIAHEHVSDWLNSWGTDAEEGSPR